MEIPKAVRTDLVLHVRTGFGSIVSGPRFGNRVKDGVVIDIRDNNAELVNTYELEVIVWRRYRPLARPIGESYTARDSQLSST